MLFVPSIIIGVVHLTTGLLLNIINKFKRKEYAEGILVTGAWLWFYLGLMWTVFNKGIVFTDWFKDLSLQQPTQLLLHPSFLL